MSATTCPIFHPTIDQLVNFEKYIEEVVDPARGKAGVCKIIPPEGWFKRDYDWETLNREIKVRNPVQQCVRGRAGIYTVDLFEKKSMSLDSFKMFAESNDFKCENGWNAETYERKFWKTMGMPYTGFKDPMYGADMLGTLFNNSAALNVDNIPTLLKLIDSKLPGITSAMLYVGSWRSHFCWHTEDLDLYSINYLHCGAAKSWYSVPMSQKAILLYSTPSYVVLYMFYNPK